MAYARERMQIASIRGQENIIIQRCLYYAILYYRFTYNYQLPLLPAVNSATDSDTDNALLLSPLSPLRRHKTRVLYEYICMGMFHDGLRIQ